MNNDNKKLKFKRELLDENTFKRTLMRLSYEIVEKNIDLSNVVLVGVKSRGIPLAEMIKENIKNNTGVDVAISSIDIKYYRDDLEKVDINPQVNATPLSVDINDKNIIIVDDVIYTGRTVRAAIDALFDHGRPSKVSLLALIDRGHRELPIRADYVGKNIPTSLNEVIAVHVKGIDDKTNVDILEKVND